MIKATLVYVCDRDQTLMIHRNRKEGDLHRGKYNGLGGKFEPGETPEECAIREVKEESGLDISNLCLKGELLFPEFDKQGRDWQVYVFRADSFCGTLIPHNREGDLEWVPIDKLLELNLWEGDRLFLPYVFEAQNFKGTLFYKDGSLDPNRPPELSLSAL